MAARHHRTKLGISIVTAIIAMTITSSGCTMPYGRQFRDTALPGIQSGVQSILTGFVDGVFASIEPEADSSDASP